MAGGLLDKPFLPMVVIPPVNLNIDSGLGIQAQCPNLLRQEKYQGVETSQTQNNGQ